MKLLPQKIRHGFTLIELLIVVAIIAILAAIAVPNFLEAQTRAKVSRAKADMRSIASAIESYRVDHNDYPYIVNYNPEPYSIPGGFYQDDEELGFGLTTPVAYITSVPEDTFGGSRDPDDLYEDYASDNYIYATKNYWGSNSWPWGMDPNSLGNLAQDGDGDTLWGLQSKGPDRAWALEPSDGGPGFLEFDQPYKWKYDPTNGTVSSGNIVRSGP